MYFVSKLNLRFLVSAWLYVFPLLLYFFLVTNTEIMSLHRESFFFFRWLVGKGLDAFLTGIKSGDISGRYDLRNDPDL